MFWCIQSEKSTAVICRFKKYGKLCSNTLSLPVVTATALSTWIMRAAWKTGISCWKAACGFPSRANCTPLCKNNMPIICFLS